LDGVTLFKITPDVTCTQSLQNIYFLISCKFQISYWIIKVHK